MSHAYCYTCAKIQGVVEGRQGIRVCSRCCNDELGEDCDPVGVRLTLDTASIRYEPAPVTFASLAAEVAALVEQKQAAYGDSFGKSGRVLRELYPEGIRPSQLDDALTVVRIVDKLFRVATDRDALGESPWKDIIGYALLAAKRAEAEKGRG